MSEPTYTEAWGVWSIDPPRWEWVADTEREARQSMASIRLEFRDEFAIVRLIPVPEVERLIAEAEQRGRDAERERCRRICIEMQASRDTESRNPCLVVADIRKSIESGEPVEGGEL